MKILITGTDGLIGSKIYEKLKLFHEVYTENEYDSIPYIMHNGEKVGTLFKSHKIDLIIHCAAKCIIRDVIKDQI